MNTQRRTLMMAVAGISAASAMPGFTQTVSTDMVKDADPVAVALGYSSDATKTDVKKFPQYASGQTCSSCVLYTGQTSSASAACPAFGGKAVSAKGWCSAWVKKA